MTIFKFLRHLNLFYFITIDNRSYFSRANKMKVLEIRQDKLEPSICYVSRQFVVIFASNIVQSDFTTPCMIKLLKSSHVREVSIKLKARSCNIVLLGSNFVQHYMKYRLRMKRGRICCSLSSSPYLRPMICKQCIFLHTYTLIQFYSMDIILSYIIYIV